MEPGSTMNIPYMVAILMTLVLITLCPGESYSLWLYPLKAWTSLKARWIVLTQRRPETRRSGFLEMDMRDFQ